jgi:hypothetical protein
MSAPPASTPPTGGLAPHGVYQAYRLGPNGELVLVAIGNNHQLLRIVIVPRGESAVAVAGRLIEWLDREEPPRDGPSRGHLRLVR